MADKPTQSPQQQAKPRKNAVPAKGVKPKKPVKKTEEGITDNALNAVVTRNAFYQDGYRALIRIVAIEAVAIVGLIIAFILFIAFTEPKNNYFATTEDGRLVPLVPLASANLSHPALISWSSQAVTDVMTFGFHDFRRRLQESSRYFTRGGWGSFTEALNNSGLIDSVKNNRQVLTAVPISAPIIRSEGVLDGRYQWEIEVPLRINVQFGQTSRVISQTIRLTIVRVSRLENPSGIGIEQWVAFQR